MKKNYLLCLGIVAVLSASAQGVWSGRATLSSTRSGATAFSIGTKGYFATGSNGAGALQNDLWEFDTVKNSWTQKASFGTTGRYGAVSFSIGTKGFVGTGYNGTIDLNDLWEWDQATNKWTQKTNFPATGREYAAAFSIGGYGYIGTGQDASATPYNDFWQYDTTSIGSWTAMTNYAGGARYGASGFSIGAKGYFAFGGNKTDLWEWDQAGNTWSQKASITGIGRNRAVAMTLGKFGFAGGGENVSATSLPDFWVWDQANNNWTQVANMGEARDNAAGFGVGGVAFVGTGHDNSTGYSLSDFYRWKGQLGLSPWIIRDSLPPLSRWGCVAFSIGGYGFFGMGMNNGLHRDMWKYDTAKNAWTQIANFGGPSRIGAVGFSIGGKGYVGTGQDSTKPLGCCKYTTGMCRDFWEYDTAANTWTQKAQFGGSGRYYAVAFSIGNKGYIGTGEDSIASWVKNFWEWDQATDTWTRKADFGGIGRSFAVGFSIGGKGYIGTGDTNQTTRFSDFWEYDTTGGGSWTRKADFPGGARNTGAGFSIGKNGFIGFGGSNANDFYEWSQATNVWTQVASLPSFGRNQVVGFSIGSKGFICGGQYKSSYLHDFWEYRDTTGVGGGILTSVTGISKENHVHVYPNPSTGIFYINSNIEKYNIVVFNIMGKIVYQSSVSSAQSVIDLSGNASGIYIYRILSDGKDVATGKLLLR